MAEIQVVKLDGLKNGRKMSQLDPFVSKAMSMGLDEAVLVDLKALSLAAGINNFLKSRGLLNIIKCIQRDKQCYLVRVVRVDEGISHKIDVTPVENVAR
jgi:hypothetical protein